MTCLSGVAKILDPDAKFYHLDFRSPDVSKVFEDEQFDVMNHHAAQMDVQRSVAGTLYDADVNILASINLIECSKKFGVKRFRYYSSGGPVFGESEYVPGDEAHSVNPVCLYGVINTQ